MKDFFYRKCPKCGDPKNELTDGQEYILRCKCDWMAGFAERLAKTVHPDFWRGDDPRNIGHWSPTQFQKGGNTNFKSLIRIQKALVIQRLDEFYHKSTGGLPAIFKSINHGRNLFIRGPKDSGRGLLLATIKVFCAAKEISCTPLPSDWSTFKLTLVESDNFGPAGTIAKLDIADNYRNVQVMTVENIRGEGTSSIYDEKFLPKRFRGATSLDDVLTRRMTTKGCMVFTSSDFIGQIGASLGDVMPEILLSDKTTRILMVTSEEADALLNGLNERYAELVSSAFNLCGLGSKEDDGPKKHIERKSEGEDIENFKHLLYMRELFPSIKAAHGDSSKGGGGIHVERKLEGNLLRPAIKKVYDEFNAEKAAGGMAYTQGKEQALILTVRRCKELNPKLSSRECLELGQMMSLACQPEDKINDIIEKAKVLRMEMAGRVNG